MAAKKIIFLGFSGTEISTLLDKIRDYQQQPDYTVVVLASGYDAQRVCQQHGLPFKTSIDYLSKKRHYRVYTESTRLAMDWYKHPLVQKTLTHDGVSLGKLMEYEIRLLFASFFLDIELYQGILEAERPDKIIMVEKIYRETGTQNPMDFGFQDEFIINSLSSEQGVSLERISTMRPTVPESRQNKSPQKSALFRAFSSFKFKLINYAGTLIFLNWPVEISRGFKKFWNYFFCSWNTHRVINAFSQKKRRIAFFNLRCASEVAGYLQKDSDNGVVFLMGPGQRQRVLSFLPVIYLESFGTPEIDNIVENKRSLFKSILENAEVINYYKEKFNYSGLSFWEVAREKIIGILDIHVPLIVRGVELIKEMEQQAGLDVFISSSDVNSGIRAMTLALQRQGKQALVVHHGIDYVSPEASEVFSKYMVPPYADKIATWGEGSRDWFIARGAPPESIEVTSCSDFDNYLKVFNRSPGALRRYLGLPLDKKVILYTLDHANHNIRHPYIVETRDEIMKHLKDVIQEIVRIPRLYLVIRTHPGDQHPEEIAQIVRDLGESNISFAAPGRSLLFYLQAADIIITYTSSSALDAMIFDKDVLIYNPTGRPELVPFSQEGAAVKVESKESIVPTILSILENNELQTKLVTARKQFVNRFAGPLDGKASRNVADLILRMVKGGE